MEDNLCTPGARVRLALTAMILALPFSGCGNQGVDLYPVQGVVVWSDGRPARELAEGVVSLQMTEHAGRSASPYGTIQSDGSFVFRSPGLGKGAAEGQYRARVTPFIQIRPGVPRPPPVMDPKFQHYDRSGLEVTVERKKNQITLTVGRAPRR